MSVAAIGPADEAPLPPLPVAVLAPDALDAKPPADDGVPDDAGGVVFPMLPIPHASATAAQRAHPAARAARFMGAVPLSYSGDMPSAPITIGATTSNQGAYSRNFTAPLGTDRVLAPFSRPNANGFLDVEDEDLPVVEHAGYHVIRNDNLDSNFGHEVDDVCRAAKDFFATPGSSEPFDFGHGHRL